MRDVVMTVGIRAMQEAMREGRSTSRGLIKSALARIESLDRSGPQLRSMLEVNPDALAIADAMDRERKQAGPRGPLHGIPVVIKANIDTADRMTTTGRISCAGGVDSRARCVSCGAAS